MIAQKKDIPVVKLFMEKNRFFLYDAVNNQLFQISKEFYIEVKNLLKLGVSEYLLNVSDKKEYFDVCALIKRGYFKDQLFEGYKNRDEEYIPRLLERCISDLQLQVSRACNFKCRYCSFAGDNNIGRSHENINMSWNVAKQSIDFLYDHSKDMPEVFIYFYGGEPLLNYELIKQSVNYAKSRFLSKRIIFGVTTNCSILNADMIDFFAGHDFIFTISFDGERQIQDSHRRFLRNGNGTYDVVINNINMIRNKFPEFYQRNVRFNVVSFVDEDKRLVYDYFSKILDKKNNHINLINPDTRGIDYYYDKVAYANEYANYKESENFQKEYKVFLDAYYNKIQLNTKWYDCGGCIAGAQRLFVSVDGSFYPCEKVPEIPVVSIGSLSSGFDFKQVLRVTNAPCVSQDKCCRCWAARFCSMCVCYCVDSVSQSICAEAKMLHCQENLRKAEKMLKEYVNSIDCSGGIR